MDFTGKIILAPLAGIGDTVFRRLCRRCGADAVVTEMVSAEGLLRAPKAVKPLLAFAEEERPLGVQLFGASAGALAAAAVIVEETVRPDFIDLNAGCPVRKVVAKNGGAALLRDPVRFAAIVGAMARAVRTPVTVKIRSGWTTGQWVDTEFARMAQDNGAAAVILHPRSKAMLFSGRSFWERIAVVKRCVTIPVIGNGDIAAPGDARAMFAQTGCDAVMIGRGSLGNPWIFGQCRRVIGGGEAFPVSAMMKLRMALEHVALGREVFGEQRAAREVKKHAAWYVRGLPGASALRDGLLRATSTAALDEILCRYMALFAETCGDTAAVRQPATV